MRQERTIQATLFEVFAQHEIDCELKAMSQWLDGQRQLTSLVAGDLRRQGVRETGRHGLCRRKACCAALGAEPAPSPDTLTLHQLLAEGSAPSPNRLKRFAICGNVSTPARTSAAG